jgi:hypothetical protein
MAPLRPEELPYPVTTIDPESVSTSQVLNSGVTVKPSRGIGLFHRRALISHSPSYLTRRGRCLQVLCNGRNHMWSAARGLSLNQWRTSLLSGKGMPSSQPSRDDPTEPRILAQGGKVAASARLASTRRRIEEKGVFGFDGERADRGAEDLELMGDETRTRDVG